uniref:Uncharacterized protein n=1 Tax=Oryza sativa subsp. japonica TaxID=39947 RepID=Q6Z0S0_ORYSJ|nr:hypothetical protein [Oryza sativa Japonica Group]BAD10391.1 hypothetical protein [Oryza sativa Japonica Group]
MAPTKEGIQVREVLAMINFMEERLMAVMEQLDTKVNEMEIIGKQVYMIASKLEQQGSERCSGPAESGAGYWYREVPKRTPSVGRIGSGESFDARWWGRGGENADFSPQKAHRCAASVLATKSSPSWRRRRLLLLRCVAGVLSLFALPWLVCPFGLRCATPP